MLVLRPNAPNAMRTGVFLAVVILASIIGCGKTKSGGGSRSVVVGSDASQAVYGIREGNELGFAIFTDIRPEGTVASAGSTWTGTIAPKTGQTIDYKGSAEGLEINGTEYKFAKGRVFLVSTKEETFTVSQLRVPIGDTNYDAELDRIIETADVQAFLRN